jgi:vanadium chloroperoxidase
MTPGGIRTRFWIDMSLECVRRDHTTSLSSGDQRGPFLTARALGMALAALHDVRAAAAGSATRLLSVPIHADLCHLPGTKEMDLAAAAACHQVLRLRYPNQAFLLEPAWLNWLDYFEMGPAGTTVEMAGRTYGTAVHQFGRDDMAHARAAYTPDGMAYNHKAPPTQPTQGFAGGAWGNATPLAATRVLDFPPPPGRLDAATVIATEQYRADFSKVAAKGEINRSRPGDPALRTLAEEVIGIAWGYDGPQELGTPPRLYLQVVLTVLDSIEERSPGHLQELEELAVIAGAAVAMADAGIDAWHYKYAPSHMMWRPAVGIREAVPGNGVADPDWLPLGRPDTNGTGTGLTPDFPAYPSGHAAFGAAAFQLLRLFLVARGVCGFDPAGSGLDDLRFEFVSDEFDGRNRDPRTQRPRDVLTLSYDSLWQAMVDNAVSRVYLGVHWQFDGITTRRPGTEEDVFGVPGTPRELGRTGGVWLGARIANQIAQKLNVPIATIAASGIC